MNLLRRKDDPYYLSPPSLQKAVCPNQVSTSSLHPEPKHIYRLWQIFLEGVNPMTKLIHVPTLQQRILDATCNLDLATIPKSLNAILFAVYNIAVVAMSAEDCQNFFNADREILLFRYRDTCLRALLEADYLTSSNMETLQASIIYLFANPEVDISISMVGSVVRLAQRLGYHVDPPPLDPRAGQQHQVSIFEREIRIRIWWQLRALENRICCTAIPEFRLVTPLDSIGDLRLPANVNDSDLHPDMTHAPQEHAGHTEMSPLLLKFQLIYLFRWNPSTSKLFECIMSKNERDLVSYQ